MQHSLRNTIKQTALYRRFDAWRWRERLVHNGTEHPEETYYVIRRHASRAGLFSFVMTNLASIDDALQHGRIPVIDMQSSENPMLPADRVGRENAWEYYFLQPCEVSLQDLQHARNVVLSPVTPPQGYPELADFLDVNRRRHWRELAARYLQVREEHKVAAQAYIRQELGGQPYLGVLCRGTDYLAQRPSGHPVQPEIDVVIRDCRRVMEERGLTQVYLATEDQEIWDQFAAAFPERLYSYQRTRYSVQADQNINDVANADTNAVDRNRDYLISILVLAQADYVLAGAANGSYGACLFRERDEDFYFYQLGLYP